MFHIGKKQLKRIKEDGKISIIPGKDVLQCSSDNSL